MSDFIHNNIRLHYEIMGEGIPFIFLHGLGGSIEQIRNIYVQIKGVKLIMPDQQGHGESEVNWENFNFQTLADDVIALVNYLKIEKFYLAGISMGAAISIAIAVSNPEKVSGLLLIRNAWTHKPMETKIQELFAECTICLKNRSLSDFKKTKSYRYISGISRYTTQAFCGYFTDEASVRNYRKFLILPGLSPIEDSSVLSKINIPTIILANQDDLVHPFEYGIYYQKCISGAKLYEIVNKDMDAAAHKAAVNQYILELLRTNKY
ncbi:alpha/beta fold hydrolase [Anaerocolumna sedimenticola]|uniref:Alpha/beta fold hydrolase n=1 Tax=Anaerocolumna sedimenticola TaxID=2696063 RepID=A0A6P1TPJ9_9FIRM|nr:alpha/beta hydrolase [Anaerocolumna sedimenticola]QHQ61555.1 alpha/beta fold hydrolase [Anaerocolumna sedimenticola]